MHQNHVITFPSEESVQQLTDIMGGCPFDYQSPSTWHVTVQVLKGQIDRSVLNTNNFFQANGVSVDHWYDTEVQRTNLVIVFVSPQLLQRHQEIERHSRHSSEYPVYVPHMTLVYGSPPLSPAVRAFVHSMNMSVRRYDWSFVGEELVDSNGYTPNVSGMRYHVERQGE